MFKQQETKNKNEGFVDEKGQALDPNANKKEEKAPVNPDDINLKAEFSYQDKALEDIETGRVEFFKTVKKQNIIKWVVATLSIGLLVFSWIYFIGQLQNYAVGLSLTGVSVAMIVAYYILIKRFNNKKMAVYLKRYYGDMNAYVFGNDRFKEVKGDIEGKIDNAEFNDNKAFKNVSTIGSRNIVTFKVDGKYECKMCDCAAQMTTVKKLEPLFIGKYLIAPNKYKGDEEIIIYLTGNSRALPPNNVEQLPKVINTRKMIVYSNSEKYGSILTANVRQSISSLITNNVLVDTFISITKGKTYIGLGYDDCLMVLPLQEKFNPLPMEKFKKDMQIIADIIVGLNK